MIKKIVLLISFGIISAIFGNLTVQAETLNELPQNDVSKINNIVLYNGLVTNHHSADSADTEGPIFIGKDSLFPQDLSTFTFGASFRAENNTVGTPLLENQYVNVLIGGMIKNYSNAYISFEENGDHGWIVGNESMEDWLTAGFAQEMQQKFYLNNSNYATTEAALLSQMDDVLTYTQSNAVKGTATELETLNFWSGSGEVPTIPIQRSTNNTKVLIIDLDEVGVFAESSDTVNIKGIGISSDILQNKAYDEIVIKSQKEKVLFTGGVYTDINGAITESALDSEFTRNIASKLTFYFPNATQVTNYTKTKSGGAPDLAPLIDGENQGVDATGMDLYDNISENSFMTAVIGSVLAPQATLVFSSGNLNGFFILKDLHQRDGMETHNFMTEWLPKVTQEPLGSILLHKYSDGANGDSTNLVGAEFILFRKNEDNQLEYYGFDDEGNNTWFTEKEQAYTFSSNITGNIAISGLPAGTYFLRETKAPEGHELLQEPIEVTITETDINQRAPVIIEVENQRQPLINFQGKKIWKDNQNGYDTRPEKIIIELYRNNESTPIETQEVSGDNDWSYTFENLPQYDEQQKLITYSVKEVSVPGYESVIGSNNHFVINTLKGTTAITGTKKWQDNDDTEGLRPTQIIVELYQNNVGYPFQTQEVSAATNWEYLFDNLDKYDSNGNLISYLVKEQEVENYLTATDAQGNLINTLTGETSLKGTKVWEDDNNSQGLRPAEITVNLLQNGQKIASQILNEGNQWSYEFTELEKYDGKGKLYLYVINEESVPGYDGQVSADGTITNVLAGTTQLNGQKNWLDDNNIEGLRPATISVNLLQNGTKIATQEVSELTNWRYEFSSLEKYDNKGKLFLYTVSEDSVPGYESEIATDGTITNLLTGQTSLSGQKVWVDNDNAAGLRPEKIVVNLLQNGTLFASQEVSSATNWQYQFNYLAKYDEQGKLYQYTVSEEPVGSYVSVIDSDGTITNQLSSKMSLSGTKIWQDNQNAENLRPEKITVNLFQNEIFFAREEVSEATNWAYVFEDLDVYDTDGKVFTYQIKEEPVGNYDTEIGADGSITNTLVGELNLSGIKEWRDDNNAQGLRPEKVIVVLYQNDLELFRQEISSVTNWAYTFNNLAMYDGVGSAFTYRIEEIAVDHYQGEVDENGNLINTLTGQTELKGKKVWVDDQNALGVRPATITVNLFQNGQQIASQLVSEKTNWDYHFTDLAQYDGEGKLFLYTVNETAVPDYETTISSDGTITNQLTGVTSLSGEKIWLDDQNAMGLRPDKIVINLYQNNQLLTSQTVSALEHWHYQFKYLEKYDQEGKLYNYRVEEEAVANYQSEISADGTIKNLLTEKTSLAGQKIWLDDNNQAGLRPTEIIVNLSQNGEKIASQVVTSETNWHYEFTDLEKYDNTGKLYDYQISEDAVTGYQTSIAEDGTITNLLSQKTELTGQKIWRDNDNQAGTRPAEIVIKLLQNGEVIATQTVSEKTNWRYLFDDLDEYDEGGRRYLYQVQEELVSGYVVSYDGSDIINTLIPSTEQPVDDNNQQPGDNPTSPNKNQDLLQAGETYEPLFLKVGILLSVTTMFAYIFFKKQQIFK